MGESGAVIYLRLSVKMVGGHGHESALTIGPAIQFMAGKTGQQIREPVDQRQFLL
jgi:hypothetical protein